MTFQAKLQLKIAKAKRYASEPHRFSISDDEATIISDHDTRHLRRVEEKWVCDCEFFQKQQTCSHTMALEEYLKHTT